MQTLSRFAYLQRGRAKDCLFSKTVFVFSAEKQTVLIKKCHLGTGKTIVRTNAVGTGFDLMQFSVSSSFSPPREKKRLAVGTPPQSGDALLVCYTGKKWTLCSPNLSPLRAMDKSLQDNVRISLSGFLCQKCPSSSCRGWRWLPRALWSWSHCPGRCWEQRPQGMALEMGLPFPYGDGPRLPPAQALLWATEDVARVWHPVIPDLERNQMKARACGLAFNHGYASCLVFPKHLCYSNTLLSITAIGK